MKHSPLKRFREVVNSALAIWYQRKFFYVSGAISLFLLASIMFLIDYGYANYGDRLISIDMSETEIAETLKLFSREAERPGDLSERLSRYSALEIVAITIASADKSFDSYYSKIVSFMFAEDIEIMLFLTIFRSRKEIFAAPKLSQIQLK